MLKTLLAAMLSLCPLAVLAAPLSSPVIDVPLATGEFVSFGDRGDLLSFDAPATGRGFVIGGDLAADLTLDFDLADPYRGAGGFIALRDDGRAVLDGVLGAISAGEDMLNLSFGDLTGDLASDFGKGLRVELFFLDPQGDDPLGALTNGGSYDIAYVVAPIPLPAGGLLLVSGVGLLTIRARSRRTA